MSNPVDLDPKEYVKTLELLKSIDFLKGMPEEELKDILLSLQSQSFPAEKTILFQGEIANRLFIVQKGSVIITTKVKSERVRLAELAAPMYFGEISLLRPTSATATAIAGADGAELIILTHDSMSSLSRKHPDITQRIQNIIDERLADRKKAKEKDEHAEAGA